jgi:hypothetical protein
MGVSLRWNRRASKQSPEECRDRESGSARRTTGMMAGMMAAWNSFSYIAAICHRTWMAPASIFHPIASIDQTPGFDRFRFSF